MFPHLVLPALISAWSLFTPATPATTQPMGPVPFPVDPATVLAPQGARSRKWEQVWTTSGLPGHASVRELPGNGGRPVAVYVSAALEASKPVTLLMYFHGHGADVGDYFRDTSVLARIRWLETTEPNTIYVCPEAASAPFHYWMAAPESFTRLEREGLAEAARLAGRTLTIGRRVISAHSGGGLALRNAVTEGQIEAERFEFLDCNYGDWGMVVADWCAEQPAGHRPDIQAWDTPGPTRTHDAEIKAAHPDLVTVQESPVGHFDIPGKLLGATLLDL